MSLTSLNFIISQFESEKYRYFIICDEDGDPIYFQNDLVDQDTAIGKLRSFFKDNNGYFTIKVFSKKLTNPKNKIEQDKNLAAKFNIELSGKIINNTQTMQGMGGLGGPFGLAPDDPRSNAPNIFQLFGQMGEVSTQMKLMEKDHQHYRELKEMEERIKAMEDERSKNTGMNGVLSTIGEQFKDPAVLMGLLSNVGQLFKKEPVVPMNGINTEVDTNIEARKQKITDSVNLLLTLDPEFPENIQALATLAKTKPEMYKMAVQYLKSM